MNKIKKSNKGLWSIGGQGLKPHGQARGPRGRAGEESAGELAAGDQRLGLGFMDVLICFNHFYSTKVCLWHVSKWFDNSELLAILCYVFVDRHCRRLVAHMTLNAWWGALAQSPTANIPRFAVRGWAEGGWKAARFDSCWQEIVPLFNDFR